MPIDFFPSYTQKTVVLCVMQRRFATFYVQLAKIFNKKKRFLWNVIRKISGEKFILSELMRFGSPQKCVEENSY
jgi:hypothetical protein